MEKVELKAITDACTAAQFNLKTRTPYIAGKLPIDKDFNFTGFKIEGDGEFKHIQLIVDAEHSISVGSLRSMMYMGTIAEAKGSISNVDAAKGFTLKGVKSLNSKLGQFSDDAKITEYLLNLEHPISAVKVEGIVMNAPFVSGRPKVITDLTVAQSLCVTKQGFILSIN